MDTVHTWTRSTTRENTYPVLRVHVSIPLSLLDQISTPTLLTLIRSPPPAIPTPSLCYAPLFSPVLPLSLDPYHPPTSQNALFRFKGSLIRLMPQSLYLALPAQPYARLLIGKQKALVIPARALGVVGCDYIAKCKALLSLGLAWV